jgi:hypothetical protein
MTQKYKKRAGFNFAETEILHMIKKISKADIYCNLKKEDLNFRRKLAQKKNFHLM